MKPPIKNSFLDNRDSKTLSIFLSIRKYVIISNDAFNNKLNS